jgi:hypothetical protein
MGSGSGWGSLYFSYADNSPYQPLLERAASVDGE